MKNTILRHSPAITFSVMAVFVLVAIDHLFLRLCGVQLPYPVALLSLASLLVCPFSATLFFLFSALGDWGGATGQFLPQMAAFATAHVLLIYYLATPFGKTKSAFAHIYQTKRATLWASVCFCLGLLVIVFGHIVPKVPEGVLTIGVSVYALLIVSMWFLSFWNPSAWIKIGSTLFLISDFILAWNKFVEPLDNARLLILVPYFSAQVLLFAGIAIHRHKQLTNKNK